ncbi:MAG: exo-alpha-sialidase, partial [Bacteroidales bacterium]|nr:exo-alpha-sialidase [Bacteroidales bacterium]
MKKTTTILFIFSLLVVSIASYGQDKGKETRGELYKDGKYYPYDVLDTRVDNMRYWRKAAELGLTPVEPYREVPRGIYKGSRIAAKSVWRDDSPDVPVTSENSTQSENSVFVNPTDPDHVLQSNNSTQNPVGQLYGANYFYSYDFGATWGGSLQGAGGGNSGDPTTAISLTGRQYVGYIHNNMGQGVSYSDDGITWTAVLVDAGSGSSMLDKNHMWIDNSPTSPYEGNLYSAWTDFGGPNDSEIEISRSTNHGISYSPAVNISSQVNAGSHNQGVNIQTGPDGQVYVVWAIYDGWPTDETAMGFTKSLDGGVTWQPATRIISNIKGIRTSETSKNHRVNSFPSMACDISGDGALYLVWTNKGVPGINSGSDIDIYMIRSTDEGATWSAPIRINQDPIGQG